MNQDPWDWVNEKKPVAPLAAGVQSSQEANPGVVQQAKDPFVGMAQQGAVNATAKGLEAGYKGYQAANAAAATAPLSANAVIGASAPAMSLAPTVVTPAAAALTEAGVAGLAAPAMSTAATGAGILGTEAAVGGALASTGATTAAGTAAGAGALAGGEAALAAMGPVGWAIGAGLLAHKLGIF
jgi:hypothetical protein